MEEQVWQFIGQFDICQRFKYETAASRGLMQPLPIPTSAWTQVSMDFIEGLPIFAGKIVILVVVDRLTKYARFIGLKHPYTAATVAQAYVDKLFKLQGLPNSIVNDRDHIFISNFRQEIQGVALKLSSTYHPQSDGQTKVVNRCLETYLRCVASDQPRTWAKWLPLAEWWYNSTYHSAIHTTPFEALYGYMPPVHLSYLPGSSLVHQVDLQLQSREEMLQLLKHHLQKSQLRMKSQADKHRTDMEFAIGDWVYLKLQSNRQNSLVDGQFRKLEARYFGPYQVLDRIGLVANKLSLPPGTQIHPVFHVSQLKKVRDCCRRGSMLPTPGGTTFEPVALLDRRIVQSGNRPAT